MAVDGTDSKQYRDAVKAFQTRKNLTANGEVNINTQNQLIKDNEANAAYVKWVQRVLNTQGACLTPNGTLGSKSRTAIRRFQECHQLTVDGNVGYHTELRLIQERGWLPPGHIARDHGKTWPLPKDLADGNHNSTDSKGTWVAFWKKHPLFQKLQTAQSPSTVVLSCSDARVTPEYIFGAGNKKLPTIDHSGVGQIFTIRTAGQVLDDAVRGTLQFAVGKWKAKTFVVLGHEDCGAVKEAVLVFQKSKPQPTGPLGALVQDIVNVIEEGERAGTLSVPKLFTKSFLVDCIKENARAKAMQVQEEFGLTKVIPAFYSLATGKVESLKL